ncbi:beta-class carbonic anhydrase [Kurthia sibirica]|uniref:carbonic anhydrase n=1 Tax=Kurthia sibirica TaxID=202750 RepID=A0A2U3AL66_9BACL|nr:carbonic anhydrase [Kurthia sibirica]PWI25286.1 carbonic anhydrase [Kurthia sibirica]GEK34657.1 carbonic anhydrase [Kurthia sibirica]
MKLDEILAFNEKFVENKDYIPYVSDGVPSKKLAIITCMDARLIELLQKAINIKNGDAKMIKTAGAQINNPYGSIMRSILVAVYALKAEEVLVIGHLNCGMNSMDPNKVIDSMKDHGISQETINTLEHTGIDLKDWLKGFNNLEDEVLRSVNVVRDHPLIAKTIPVHGLTIDPTTGKLTVVTNGYSIASH